MKKWLSIILVAVAGLLSAQAPPESDLQLLGKADFADSTLYGKRQSAYVFADKNWFVKYNPVSLLLGGALYLYQAVISPQIMQGCAFHPSCSNFSKGCIREYGFVKGAALSADRLTRCTRLSAIDFHPVLFNEEGKVNDFPDYYRLQP